MPTTYGQQLAQQMGTSAASGLIGGAMGLIFGGINDRRQLKQQQALQDMQIKGEKEMADYNMANQYDMWLKTNYGAQVEQLNKAGLNPGLLYNSAGGQPVLGSPSSNVTGATAQQNPGEQAMGMQVAMQSQLIQAQTALTEAQAKKTEAEIPNVAKTGKQIDASIENLTAGTENTRANTRLQQVQTSIQDIELMIKEDTYEDTENQIKQAARQASITTSIMTNDKTISDATIQTKIDTMVTNLAVLTAENELKKSQKNLTDEQITEIKNSIKQKWAEIKIAQQNANTNKQNADTAQKNANTNERQYLENVRTNIYGTADIQDRLRFEMNQHDLTDSEKAAYEALEKVLGFGILGGALKTPPGTKPPSVQGFQKRY